MNKLLQEKANEYASAFLGREINIDEVIIRDHWTDGVKLISYGDEYIEVHGKLAVEFWNLARSDN